MIGRSELVERLRVAGCVAADDEADELLAAARSTGAVVGDVGVPESWVERRESGEPLAWITGRLVFCGQVYSITSGVYVPRPHTEDLADRAAVLLPARGRALNLCCGSGVIAAHLAAAVPSAFVVATDIDVSAVGCARSNGVAAVRCDVADAIGGAATGTFDVVTAVAPYVPTEVIGLLPRDVQAYEPRHALDGGDDGTVLLRRVVTAAARLLRPGGHLLLELGGDQAEGLADELERAGFDEARSWRDAEGDVRGVVARQRRDRM